ncbi:proteasome subunit beta type-1-A [Exaiptasia diaphana]|uniref:Proteasome subunit beta n=1 Tax=Exaiptasia diaphana TaxID=2652724 RepID=A0A913YS72_EXADI|nr:proteasome subunit beta type-1-A [Exaiptasia diaphana]
MSVDCESYYGTTPVQHYFSPYAFNGGTVLAISGEDFAVIASDTRLSQGFQIHTRDSPKLYKLTKSTVLGCSGFHGDCLTLTKHIDARLQMYEHEHGKKMSCPAIAQMLSTMLYYRRFFPYYTYNILAGLDTEGKGCVFSFDPIGFKNQAGVEPVALSQEKAVSLVKDVFSAATERDIYTGDSLVINLITKDGVKEEYFPLRRD